MIKETIKYVHVCEACGLQEILTPQEAYDKGWDYPPNMGAWGVISPRTCGGCTIDQTVWWALMANKKTMDELTESQKATLERILGEPASVAVK